MPQTQPPTYDDHTPEKESRLLSRLLAAPVVVTARCGDRHTCAAAADNTEQRWLRRSVAVSDQPHPGHGPGLIERNIDRLHDARDTVVAVA